MGAASQVVLVVAMGLATRSRCGRSPVRPHALVGVGRAQTGSLLAPILPVNMSDIDKYGKAANKEQQMVG